MADDVKTLIRYVLKRGDFASLATLDDEGIWVFDVAYLHDAGFNLYWRSEPNTRHSRAILANPRVAGTVTISGRGEDNFGIQFEGRAKRIEGRWFDLAEKQYAKQNRPGPKEGNDVVPSDSWYVMKPTRIDLICEARFGYEKQRIDLPP
ncbi:MAG TPA: pyridoxamine 5'-phosphate oxidase family protein [Candidatus Manganitrophaceae bacterium]|nr:pyridoxamine 5'-phosphate oxidase family protein [Candidatus Manganitrophaceae bacterium]